MKNINIISFFIAVVLIGATIIITGGSVDESTLFTDKKEQVASVDKSTILLGELESTHEHMTMLIVVDGKVVNLTQGKYMLKDYFSHLENDNGFIIHKHAIGVTLPYFLSTLGIDLTQNCITLDTGMQYCNSSSDNNTLQVIINGNKIRDINTYELRHKDKILINYGDDNDTELQFKFNSIPDVPIELL